MKRNGREYKKANVEYMDFIDFAKLLRKRGYADLYMNFTDTEIDKNLKVNANEEIRISPLTGIKRFAANIVSKIKAQDNNSKENNTKEIYERE